MQIELMTRYISFLPYITCWYLLHIPTNIGIRTITLT